MSITHRVPMALALAVFALPGSAQNVAGSDYVDGGEEAVTATASSFVDLDGKAVEEGVVNDTVAILPWIGPPGQALNVINRDAE